MKETYKDLRCPHCGAKEFRIVQDDVFLCEYCNQNFHFDVADIPLTAENSVFIEEIKEKFAEKIVALNEKKRQSRACLLYFTKRANPTKLHNISIVILALSSFMFFSSFFTESLPLKIFYIVAFAISLPLFVFAKIRKKKRWQKYRHYVSHYAAEIADYDEQINFYTKQISKLTR